MTIFPKHIYGVKNKSFGSDFDEIAVGSGPYKIKSFEFGKHITFEKNKNWWGKNLGLTRVGIILMRSRGKYTWIQLQCGKVLRGEILMLTW